MPTLEKRIESLEKQAPKLHGQALLISLWAGFLRANPELAERVRRERQQKESQNANS